MNSTPARPDPSRAGIRPTARCSSSRSIGPGQHLLHQPVDDLDAGQVALVHGAVEGLAGERLLVQRAVRVAVEEAADLVLELAHPRRRPSGTSRQAISWCGSHLPPSIVSMKWRSTESPGAQRDVVAALHHAGAAAFAEQPLHGDRDVASGAACWACRAANRPAPPVPMIRMSVSCRSAIAQTALSRKVAGDQERQRRRGRGIDLLAATTKAGIRARAGEGRRRCARPAGTRGRTRRSSRRTESVQRSNPSSAASPPSAVASTRKCAGRNSASNKPGDAVQQKGEPERMTPVRADPHAHGHGIDGACPRRQQRQEHRRRAPAERRAAQPQRLGRDDAQADGGMDGHGETKRP